MGEEEHMEEVVVKRPGKILVPSIALPQNESGVGGEGSCEPEVPCGILEGALMKAMWQCKKTWAACYNLPATNVEDEKPCSSSTNIKVYVRVRPLSKEECTRGETVCIHVTRDDRSVKVVEQGYGYNQTTRSFQFDGCIGPEAEQQEVMKKVGMKRLLDKVLDGYSSTVMACGQTGSGKTFTMSGREEDPFCDSAGGDDGLIARSATYLFEAIKKRGQEYTNSSQTAQPFTMRASYFEIYTEQVNDLLRLDAAPRDVKWSSRDGFYVENLLLVDCDTLDDVFSVLNEGAKNRKVGSHELNKDSSRSHCIMTLHVDSVCQINDDGPPIIRYGRMLFVDLAGSERLKKSKSSGEMLKETGSINRSLFTLGKVISCLSEGKKGDVVPYRESMLTKLLMESLGGKSLALMIACVSPAASAVDETLSTLHYATCANNIVNAPAVNLDSRDKIVLKLQKEIAQLKEENQMLRAKLGEQNIEFELSTNSVLPSPPPSSRTKRGRVARNPTTSSSDKWPLELKGIEKYFSKDLSIKDFTKEPATTTPGLSVFAAFQDQAPQNDSGESSLSAASRCVPSVSESNSSMFNPSLETNSNHQRLYRDSNGTLSSAWGDINCCNKSAPESYTSNNSNIINNNNNNNNNNNAMTPHGVHSEPQSYSLRSCYEPNSLLGMYRGLSNAKVKGLQHFSRRNRLSVDHLGSSRTRVKKGPGKNGKNDPRFQGSITVNQSAFLKRLLDLNISPVEDMVNF